MAPFAVGGAYLSPELDSPEEAGRILARATEQVPQSIPVTTLVLGADTQDALRKLLQTGNYDAVVAEASLLDDMAGVRAATERRDRVLTIAVSRCFDTEEIAVTSPPT